MYGDISFKIHSRDLRSLNLRSLPYDLEIEAKVTVTLDVLNFDLYYSFILIKDRAILSLTLKRKINKPGNVKRL